MPESRLLDTPWSNQSTVLTAPYIDTSVHVAYATDALRCSSAGGGGGAGIFVCKARNKNLHVVCAAVYGYSTLDIGKLTNIYKYTGKSK